MGISKKASIGYIVFGIILIGMFVLAFWNNSSKTPTAKFVAGASVDMTTEKFLDSVKREAGLGAERTRGSLMRVEQAIKTEAGVLKDILEHPESFNQYWEQTTFTEQNGFTYSSGSAIQYVFPSEKKETAQKLIATAIFLTPTTRYQYSNAPSLKHVEYMFYDGSVLGVYPPTNPDDMVALYNYHVQGNHYIAGAALATTPVMDAETAKEELKKFEHGSWIEPQKTEDDVELPFMVLVTSNDKRIAMVHGDVDAQSLAKHLKDYPSTLYQGAFAFIADEEGKIVLLDASRRGVFGLAADAEHLSDSSETQVRDVLAKKLILYEPMPLTLTTGRYLAVPAKITGTWTYILVIPWESLPFKDLKNQITSVR